MQQVQQLIDQGDWQRRTGQAADDHLHRRDRRVTRRASRNSSQQWQELTVKVETQRSGRDCSLPGAPLPTFPDVPVVSLDAGNAGAAARRADIGADDVVDPETTSPTSGTTDISVAETDRVRPTCFTYFAYRSTSLGAGADHHAVTRADHHDVARSSAQSLDLGVRRRQPIDRRAAVDAVTDTGCVTDADPVADARAEGDSDGGTDPDAERGSRTRRRLRPQRRHRRPTRCRPPRR